VVVPKVQSLPEKRQCAISGQREAANDSIGGESHGRRQTCGSRSVQPAHYLQLRAACQLGFARRYLEMQICVP
jgi:hypothetical protein